MTPANRLPVYADPTASSILATMPAPRRALFLDRDGVINVDRGYVHTEEHTVWVPGIFELVRAASEAGHVAIVVTNQAGIARGYYSEREFLRFTAWMHGEFRERGAALLATYYCPHHPQGRRGPYHGPCLCRKPAPGMLLQALADWDIDPAASLFIGDKASDIDAGHAARISRNVLVDATAPPDWKQIAGSPQARRETCP